jgi:two-component system chemotaxis response regulator CheB
VVEALALGAVDLVHKPTALASDQLYDMGSEIVAKVLTAAGARVLRGPDPKPQPAATGAARGSAASATASGASAPVARARVRLIVVGASTGGPQALARLVAALPADLPVPVAVVLHLPAEYTDTFARRLASLAAVEVVEAADRMPLRPGLVMVSRGGIHLKIERSKRAADAGGLVARLDPSPIDSTHRPSVDALFESAAEVVGSAVLGVVLTGMGDDGLRGASRIREAGGAVVTEAESSCVVYGMPRVVREANLAVAEAPIDRMAELILGRL